MQNLELKAYYHDFQRAVERAEALGTSREWTHTQIDTYYIVSEGKLKLRQVDGRPAELISYKRPAEANAKVSDYRLFRSDSGDVLHQVLSHVHEVDVHVVKERTLYLWENVRIHIDRVESLGNFIEFEAVMSENDDIKLSHQRVDFLIQHFDIPPERFIDCGYYELLKKDQLHA